MRLTSTCLAPLALLPLVLASGCLQSASTDGTGATRAALIMDQLHNGGTEGFLFLPPMVPRPGRLGDIVPELPVTVSVDEVRQDGSTIRPVATFTTGGPRDTSVRYHLAYQNELNGGAKVNEDDNDGDTDPLGYYVARWRTEDDNLSLSAIYRVRVLVPAAGGKTRELGFADVDVVRNKKQFRNVDTEEYTPLVNGDTLRIKFRVDRPAVDADGDGVFDWKDNCPTTANQDQTDSLGDGVGDACRCERVKCPEAELCHSPGVCNAKTGACDSAAEPDGTSCGGGLVCRRGGCFADVTGFGRGPSNTDCLVLSNGDAWCRDPGDDSYRFRYSKSLGYSEEGVYVEGLETARVRPDLPVLTGGDNTYGQLGNGTFDRSAEIGKVLLAPGKPLIADQVRPLRQGYCAVVSGRVGCWGRNHLGQLGSGTPGDRSLAPTEDAHQVRFTVDSLSGEADVAKVDPASWRLLSGVTALSCASNYCIAVGEKGTLWWWGSVDGKTARPYARQVPLARHELEGDLIDVVAGERGAALRFSRGLVWSSKVWVNDVVDSFALLLGNDDKPLSGVTELLAWGDGSYCALAPGGAVSCWGENPGDGTEQPSAKAVPLRQGEVEGGPLFDNVVSMGGNLDAACFRRIDPNDKKIGICCLGRIDGPGTRSYRRLGNGLDYTYSRVGRIKRDRTGI